MGYNIIYAFKSFSMNKLCYDMIILFFFLLCLFFMYFTCIRMYSTCQGAGHNGVKYVQDTTEYTKIPEGCFLDAYL